VFERFRYFIQTQDEFWQLGFVFTFTLTNCLYLLFRVYGGKCEKLSYGPYYCNPNENCESLPASNLIFLGFTPVLATMVLSRWRVIAVSLIWIMILITLSVVAAMEYQPWEIWTLVLVLLLPLLIIYDLRYKDYERYIATQQLREALNENKRLNEEQKESDLRAMLGNVAHDLKTVNIFFISIIFILKFYCLILFFLFVLYY
jgi:signal transduction histidine kinase